MQPVTVYTRLGCPYCVRALSLLRSKGAPFDTIDATFNAERRQEMIERSGRSTYPQIFIGETHVGGCDDLFLLEREGRLDALLEGQS